MVLNETAASFGEDSRDVRTVLGILGRSFGRAFRGERKNGKVSETVISSRSDRFHLPRLKFNGLQRRHLSYGRENKIIETKNEKEGNIPGNAGPR